MNAAASETIHDNPVEAWEVLKGIIDSGDSERLSAYLDSLTSGDTARAISRLDQDSQNKLLALLDPQDAAGLIEELPDAQAKELIEELPDDTAAAIVEELPSDEKADILGSLDKADAEAILQEMDPIEATEARHLLSYPHDTAGGLMITEFLVYTEGNSAQEILEDLRKNAERYRTYDVLYAYVIGLDRTLKGVVKLRDLILAPRDAKMDSLMIRDPVYTMVSMKVEDLDTIFNRHDFYALPVIDERHHLVGLVQKSAVMDALEARADKTFLLASGILGGEELRSLSVQRSLLRRLSVLTAKIGLNMISVNVISIYSNTISEMVSIAIFLPMISDLGGVAGNQSVAVSIRELSLGLLKPRDYTLVLWHEFKLGLRAGLLLGIFLGGVAYLWKGSILLGVVVFLAQTLASIVGFTVGGVLPLAMKKLKIDPAVASSALLTTITDTAGFFFLLSIASIMLHYFR